MNQNWTVTPESLHLDFWNAFQIWKDQPCWIHLQTWHKHCKLLATTLWQKHSSYHHFAAIPKVFGTEMADTTLIDPGPTSATSDSTRNEIAFD